MSHCAGSYRDMVELVEAAHGASEVTPAEVEALHVVTPVADALETQRLADYLADTEPETDAPLFTGTHPLLP